MQWDVPIHQSILIYRGVELTEASKLTLVEWLDQWLDERMAGTIREHTLEGYRRDISNHIKPYLGEKQLTKIKPDDLKYLYVLLLERGKVAKGQAYGFDLTPATVHSIHALLLHALRTAAEEGLLPSNPADEVTPPKISTKPKGILNSEQLATLMAAICQDEFWHDFFYTELTTSLRRGELCGLKWEDFDSKAGTLKVCRTIHAKKGSGLTTGDTKTYAGMRTILLPHSTAQLLQERKHTTLTEWIFPDLLKPENPTHPNRAYRQLKKLLAVVGLPDIRFHGLGHPNVKPKTKVFEVF